MTVSAEPSVVDPAVDPALVEFARRIPKADLHCHLLGTVTRETASELARREGARWPADPAVVYGDINSAPPEGTDFGHTAVPLPGRRPEDVHGWGLLAVTEWVADLLTRPEDLVRIGHEALGRAVATSNTRHLELHVEVGAFLRRGHRYPAVVDALLQGLRASAAEHGCTFGLIAGIDRSRPPAEAVAVVEEVLAAPRPEVRGIGLDNLETAGPPESFAEAYALAGRAGLRRTAHAGEHEPTARNVAACLDVLGCDRIDHGYFALEDPAVVERLRERRTACTCIFTTSRRSWQPWRRESIRRLAAAGVAVVVASDDPGMFPTTLADEYATAVDALALSAGGVAELALRGLDAAWLDDAEKAAVRVSFEAETARLRGPRRPDPSNGV